MCLGQILQRQKSGPHPQRTFSLAGEMDKLPTCTNTGNIGKELKKEI